MTIEHEIVAGTIQALHDRLPRDLRHTVRDVVWPPALVLDSLRCLTASTVEEQIHVEPD